MIVQSLNARLSDSSQVLMVRLSDSSVIDGKIK